MWQVYLFLANERQDRERETTRRTRRPRRWPFGRRDESPARATRRAADARAS